ncbi:MAG: glycosyltransferase [Gammaproteobacteria bacterium]|nr:glycosyltransferase [Gammaproteobacteria bacterium]
MKFCVVTPLFAFSGVPLAQIRFARALAGMNHGVDLVMGRIDPMLSFPELDNVCVINMNKRNVRGLLFPLIKYLRKAKPDVIFSAEDHLNVITLMALILSGSKAKFSGSSRVTPFDTYSNTPFTKRWILKQFMRLVMPRANALTCVSNDMVDQYKQVFKSPPHVCVYNIVDDRHSRKKLNESIDDPWLLDKSTPTLVAAGSLAPWKGFPDLIGAMKELIKTRQARLIIFGDGPSLLELQALIDELDLGEAVKLFGRVGNPLKYFSHADVFVLSSYVEGLPNVLVEAMMCGCTPVSTDCPTGPKEVLQDGKYGYLVPVRDPVAMAASIEKALDSPIPAALLNEAIRPFSEHEVIKRHFEVLGISDSGYGH